MDLAAGARVGGIDGAAAGASATAFMLSARLGRFPLMATPAPELPSCLIANLPATRQFGNLIQLRANPLIKLGYLVGGLAIRVIFVGGFPGREGMGEGGALLQGDRRNFEAMHSHGSARVGHDVRCIGRHGIEDHKALLARELDDASSRPDSAKVQYAGTA